MLNELQRSPKELYQLLSPKDQKQFEFDINYREGSVQKEDEDGHLEQIQTMLRYDKRFPYFALKYFEETKAFATMRFQVYLGKLVTDYYLKKMQGTEEDRYILDEIFVYQNLSEIDENRLKEDLKWDIFKAEYDENGIATNSTKAKSGQIVQFSPHYHFSGTDDGRIALKLNPSPIPTIKAKSEQKNGRTLYELSEKGIQADAYISTDELADLFLYYYLNPDFGKLNDLQDAGSHDSKLLKNRTDDEIKPLLQKEQFRFMKDIKASIHYQKSIDLWVEALKEGQSIEKIIEKVSDFEMSDALQINPSELLIRDYIQSFKKLFKDLQEGTLQPIEAKKLAKRKITKKDLKVFFHKRKSKESDEFVLKKYLPYDQAHFEDLEKRKKALQEILNEKYKRIEVDYLPDEVQRYLLGFYPLDYRKEVLGKLKTLKQETQKRQKQLEKQLERQKAKDYNPKKDLKQGLIADFLAKDIIYLKPYAKPHDRKDPKQGKPNNDQFRRLQQLLAQYGGHKNELSKFFVDLGLTYGNATHPFLGQVLDKYGNMPTTLFEFYDIYLAKRANHFEDAYKYVDVMGTLSEKIKGHLGYFYKNIANQEKKEKEINAAKSIFLDALYSLNKEKLSSFLQEKGHSWAKKEIKNCKTQLELCYVWFNYEDKQKYFF